MNEVMLGLACVGMLVASPLIGFAFWYALRRRVLYGRYESLMRSKGFGPK
jgi:hypothetical protein